METLVKYDKFDLARAESELDEYPWETHNYPHEDDEDDALAALAPQAHVPYARNCTGGYNAVHKGGSRPLSAIIWLILHSEEAPTALAAATWFTRLASGGSAHQCLDDNVCYKTLDDKLVPWAAPGANYHGFHIEQAGYAHWPRAEWLKHKELLHRTATKLAYASSRYNIPLRYLTPAQLRAGYKGVSTHARVTLAFGPPGGHTDPGPGYPMDLTMQYARKYRAQLGP
jgi:hypothetical protein